MRDFRMFVCTKRLSVALFAIIFLATSSHSQVDTLCAGGGAVRLSFDFDTMLAQIQAYRDTISAIAGTTFDEDYLNIESVSPRKYMSYDGFELSEALEQHRLLLAQARASAGDDVCAPCTMIRDQFIYNSYDYSVRELCGTQSYCYIRTLLTETFRNGDDIDLIGTSEDEAWASATGPARSTHPFVDTSPSGLGLQPFEAYGYHYNLQTVVDERNLCPPGWALPDSSVIATALSENELPTLMRREPDGTWIEDETWTVNSPLGSYETNDRTVSMNALRTGNETPGEVAFYAKNQRDSYSTFGLPTPNSGYLDANDNHGVTVGCYLLGFYELAEDPYYIEWEEGFRNRYPARATAADAAQANNLFLTSEAATHFNDFHSFPHVRTEAASGSTLNGDLFYSNATVEEVGFVIGNAASLANSDTLTAGATNTIDLGGGTLGLAGQFSLDTVATTNLFFCAYSKVTDDNVGARYMFGDTLEFVIP